MRPGTGTGQTGASTKRVAVFHRENGREGVERAERRDVPPRTARDRNYKARSSRTRRALPSLRGIAPGSIRRTSA